MENQEPMLKRVVCVGGGHCNVQVLKALKSKLHFDKARLTLVNELPLAFYSGMLPGSICSKNILYRINNIDLYKDEEI